MRAFCLLLFGFAPLWFRSKVEIYQVIGSVLASFAVAQLASAIFCPKGFDFRGPGELSLPCGEDGRAEEAPTSPMFKVTLVA